MEDLGVLLREVRLENGVGLDRLSRLTGKSKGHLSRIERGERPVSPALVLAYERALGVQLESIRERLRSQTTAAGRTDVDDPMRRRNLVGTVMMIATGAATLSTLASRVTEPDPLSPPNRVGMSEVTEVEEATQQIASWDLRHGGRLAVEQGRSLLRWCMVLLNATMSPTTKRSLCSATSYLADRAAWASYDSGQHDLAIKLFQLGLHLATEAHDANLRAQVLSDMANQQIFLRQPAAALTLTAVADDDDGVLPDMRAALHTVRAEAYGALGHGREMWAQLGHAESALVVEPSGERPQWMGAFRNEATLHESAGNALYHLAQAGRGKGSTAIDRLSTAAAALPAHRARARLTCATRLAVLHFSRPDGDVSTGVDAVRKLDTVHEVRSVRLRRDLRTLRAVMGNHAGRPEVQDLLHELDERTDSLV